MDTQTTLVLVSNFFTMIASFSLTLMVYWQAPKNIINLSFSALMLTLSFFSVGTITTRFINDLNINPNVVYDINHILYSFFITLFYLFTALFAERANKYLLGVGVFMFGFMPFIVVTGLLYTHVSPSESDPNGFVIHYTALGQVFQLITFAYLLVIVFRLRDLNDSRARPLWYAGLAVLTGVILLSVLRPLSTSVSEPLSTLFTVPYNSVMLSVAALIMGRTVLEHQLFDPLRRLNADLQVVNEELRKSNQIREQFLAHMSHELRTPLGAIISYNTMIRDGYYGEINTEQHDRLDRAVQNAHRLLAMINDVLDLSTLNAGELRLKVAMADAKDLVKVAIKSIAVLAETKNLDIDVEIPAEPLSFQFDQQHIYQVLVNLLSNAVKFTDFGKITVRLVHDGETATFSVTDTGEGILPEHQTVIFESFKQIENKKATGTGLGLAITKQIVELHGGSIWVDSTHRQGSTFYFTLPIKEQPTPA